MYSLLVLVATLGESAFAQDTPPPAATTRTAPLAPEEQTFRGKLKEDHGLWKYGHITLTEAAIVVETHHFPFRLDTEGTEYDTMSSEFKSSRGLFRGSVYFKTVSGSVTFLCPAKQTKALTAALKERSLSRKAATGMQPRPVEKRTETTTTTITTTTGVK